jgi:hypothetical protein
MQLTFESFGIYSLQKYSVHDQRTETINLATVTIVLRETLASVVQTICFLMQMMMDTNCAHNKNVCT